ncbi:MAG: hypothetical protein A07HR60_00427 [uncultured archaeon A07HR60]|jgi:hypothetical protein|nr:MAG: hypothetical protein J07HR59_00039 [Halorubrum sp. J07HR59]ESS12728.1 MAG: hypothetical protein A07HR60_00427 [uncultured archaeon A07HR60]
MGGEKINLDPVSQFNAQSLSNYSRQELDVFE